jgi:hypothetical protein
VGETIVERRRRNLELLIKAGADVNFVFPEDEGGGTLAIDAADLGWFEGLYILLEAGADYRPKTVGGGYDVTYPLMRRKPEAGSEEAKWRDKVVKLLQDRGADLEPARKRVTEEELKDRKEHPWLYESSK